MSLRTDLRLRWVLLTLGICGLAAGCHSHPDTPKEDMPGEQTDAGGWEPGMDGGSSGDAGVEEPTDSGPGEPSDSGPGEPSDGGMGEPPDGGMGEPPDGGPEPCSAVWRGDHQEGTSLADEGLAVWADADGNLYTVGYEQGIVGATNIEPTGDSRAVVSRYAPDGTRVWRRVIDTPGSDIAEHLTGDNQGRLYILGRTTGALPGFSNGGQFDLFVVELDAQGNTVRSLQLGDERPQHPLKVGSDPSGNVAVAGFDDMFVLNRQVMDTENGFVGRLPRSQDEPPWWSRSATFFNPDRITGFTLSPLGDELYVSGFKNFDDEESLGGGFVRRLDKDGTQHWFTQIASAATEVDELLISPKGDLFAAGSTLFPIGGEGQGAADAYLALLDRKTGTVQWVSKTGTRENDLVTSLAVGPSGDLYVAGDTFGSFRGYANQGGRDLFVLRFDDSGSLLGVWQRGTSANEHAAGLWVDSCNHVFLTGYTEGALLGDGGNAGSRDTFLMRVPLPE